MNFDSAVWTEDLIKIYLDCRWYSLKRSPNFLDLGMCYPELNSLVNYFYKCLVT